MSNDESLFTGVSVPPRGPGSAYTNNLPILEGVYLCDGGGWSSQGCLETSRIPSGARDVEIKDSRSDEGRPVCVGQGE